MSLSRRNVLGFAAASVAFGGVSRAFGQDATAPQAYRNQVEGYGELQLDPNGLFDLPKGFSYKVISKAGQPMDDGLLTPDRMDGMGCFPAGRGRVALIRNHEVGALDLTRSAFGKDGALAAKLDPAKVFDKANGFPMGGGTSRLIWDVREQRLVAHHLSLAGTAVNCAGGVTPRNTWLTCEETTIKAGKPGALDHGWAFEVPAKGVGLADPAPIKAMGRFRREATATDPRTGIVYQTEDLADGLLYRYLPNDPDKLLAGGRLQALGLKGPALDLRNWKDVAWRQGEWLETVWIDVDEPESPNDDLRVRGAAKGAAKFARGEGLFWGKGEVFITCTSGGPTNLSQVLRYVPSRHEGKPGEKDEPGRLQLFFEPTHPEFMSMADNIAISPWGHLFCCEDKQLGQNQLKAITPDGKIYTVGRNAMKPPATAPVNTELAGVCFSPDGSTLFLNLYYPGSTLAITGPWKSLRA